MPRTTTGPDAVDAADILWLASLVFAAAALYSAVGHAGASGYLAAMALFGLAPAEMKPAALSLNVLVGALATWRYTRAGFFSRALFVPLALAAVPCAFLGGFLTLPDDIYRPVVGAVLLFAAWRMFADAPVADRGEARPAPLPALLFAGAAIGLLSGLTGVGGGIFLSPLLLFFRWGRTREVSGVAAAFILLNSLAGLAGALSKSPALPEGLPWWALAALLGGLLGTELGTRRLGVVALRRVLALVLVVAGGKMILA